jgi:two-component system chemotaxis sensor kinase CheA
MWGGVALAQVPAAVTVATQLELLIEEFARCVMDADAGDRASLQQAVDTLGRLCAALDSGDPRSAQATSAHTSLKAQLSSGKADGARILAAATQLATALQQPGVAASAPGAVVERDADTIEVIAALLEEGGDGLTRADEILMSSRELDADQVNALFRVFHSIKGVAGFIDLTQICAVAHTTETLLDLGREQKLTIRGESLNLIFDATALMRRLMAAAQTAVQNRAAIADVPEVDGLVAKLERLIHQASSASPAVEIVEKPPEEEAAPAFDRPAALRETLKVDVSRVDSVVEMIGELIIVESMLEASPELAGARSLQLRTWLGQLNKISRELQDVAMRMRMVPVRGVFQKMTRLTRDLAHKTGRDVVMVLSGEDTEMDRSMVERIEEPLVHMVRNAVDHGVETAEQRRAAGKPEQATLRLSACHEGGNVIVELADDGRGLNREAILKRAIEKGLVQPADSLSDEDVYALIFAPGFSTAVEVTQLSGRGVGMDVVKRTVESMRGRITLSTVGGKGTGVRLVLPLTLAIIDGTLVSSGDERFVIPSLSIVESLRPTPAMVYTLGEREEFLDVRGGMVPLLRLGRIFDVARPVADPAQGLAVVVENGGRRVALLVDDVLNQQQVVIKPIGPGLGDAGDFSGAAILSDGRAGLILNVDRLLTRAPSPSFTRRAAQAKEARS